MTEQKQKKETKVEEVIEIVDAEKETVQELNQEELTKILITSGVDPEVAKVTAANVAKQKAEEKAEEPTVEEPVTTEEPEAEVPTITLTPRPWFERAVKALAVPRKVALIGELTMQQIDSEDETESDEIQKEIDRLKSDKGDDRFQVLMNGYIVEAKGWKVTESGKLADFAYLTGDVTQKGVATVTGAVGKATTWTGEKIAKGGNALQDNATKAGVIARKPADAVGKVFDKSMKKEKK